MSSFIQELWSQGGKVVLQVLLRTWLRSPPSLLPQHSIGQIMSPGHSRLACTGVRSGMRRHCGDLCGHFPTSTALCRWRAGGQWKPALSSLHFREEGDGFQGSRGIRDGSREEKLFLRRARDWGGDLLSVIFLWAV